MKKVTLVLGNSLGVWLGLLVILAGRPPAAQAGTFGQRILLPGHISEIILDEPRSVVYAADFSAGQVDVISTTTNRLVSSFNIGGPGSLLAPSGIAMSPNGQYLVVTNYKNLGVPTGSSVTVINLSDLSRQDYSILSPPLAISFGADGVALITTTADIERFNPGAGTFQVVSTIASLATFLPVPEPKFPQQITSASMTSSGDGNYIFGLTNAFLFVYRVKESLPTLNIRTVTSLFNPLANFEISAAFDGSYLMAGQYLMDQQLRVMAEFPNVNLSAAGAGNQPVFGGHAIDFGIKTVYASFPEPTGGSTSTTTNTNVVISTVKNPDGSTTTNTIPGTSTTTTPSPDLPPTLLVMDAYNLNIRDTFNLPERITGRMVLGGTGRYLYAISESGLLYLPLSDLATLPQIRLGAAEMFFQFDFCQSAPLAQTLQINGRGDFQISSTVNGVTIIPNSGTAPATVTVRVDVAGSFNLSKTQGTTHGQLQIFSTSAVNQIGLPIKTATGQIPAGLIGAIPIDINVKDSDQRGTLIPIPGRLTDVLADPLRDQFYVIEQSHNQVMVFQNSDFRLLATFPAGNTPNWMGFSPDGRYLLVANLSGENLTVINLDTMQSLGYLFTPQGHYPMSVASDNASTLVAVRVGGSTAQMDIAQVPDLVSPLATLGVYANSLAVSAAMVPLANQSGLLIAESDGNVKIWDANLRKVVLARQPFTSLLGPVAAGPSSVVVESAGTHQVLNLALVPTGSYTDTPNIAAGFAFTPNGAIRTASPGTAVTDTGTIQRANPALPGTHYSPVRLAETPVTTITFPFIRSLSGLRNGNIVSIATTGLVQLPGAFDAGVAVPQVSAITSAADFSSSLGPGGLVTIFGQNLSGGTSSAGSVPLPTELANMCVTMNGQRLPLLYTSPSQINAQVPFEVAGTASTVIHASGGLSSTYYAQVDTTAPSIFQIPVSGISGTIPAIVRAHNGQLASLSNPLHKNDVITVYATGLGAVGPAVADGSAGASSPLSFSAANTQVMVGGVPGSVFYSGLAPGFVGVYQLNLGVPGNVPQGTEIPLTITVGGASTTVQVRVVD